MYPPILPPPLPGKPKSSLWVYVLAAVGGIALFALIGIAVNGFQKAREKRVAARHAMEELETSTSKELKNMANGVEHGDTAGASDAVGRMQSQLDKTASKMSGEDAAIVRAMSGYLGQMQAKGAVYEAVLGRLLEASVLRFKSTDHETLVAHREILKEFAAANEQLSAVIKNAEHEVRGALVKAKISDRKITGAMNGFNKSRKSRALQLQIRECDRVLGETGLAVIDLLENTRGKWKRNEANGNLVFAEGATLEKFNSLMRTLQEASSEQAKVQKELVAFMRQQ